MAYGMYVRLDDTVEQRSWKKAGGVGHSRTKPEVLGESEALKLVKR
jgi:hypothetical protein